MPSNPIGLPQYHRGSCICTAYDLRITERCLVEDLQLTIDTSFEEAMTQPIVKAFVAKNKTTPFSGKAVGPEDGARTIYRLAVGDDHRGATWHDPSTKSVWLCSYGLHRSGEASDSFQKFSMLLKSDRIYPEEGDYHRLIFDRQVRFVEMASSQAMSLRETAISNPGIVQTGIIGYRVPVRVIIFANPGLVDLTIAFPPASLKNQQEINFVVSCFAPEQEPEIDITDNLGWTPLLPNEIAFQIMTRA